MELLVVGDVHGCEEIIFEPTLSIDVMSEKG